MGMICNNAVDGNIISDNYTQFPLIQTEWGHRTDYAKFSPNESSLGDWASNIAQILHFHRIGPRPGKIAKEYKTTAKVSIWSSKLCHKFDFTNFSKNSSSGKSSQREEMFKFVYLVSVMLQRDFGAKNKYFLTQAQRAAIVMYYFPCLTKFYNGDKTSLKKAKTIIYSEISHRRPVFVLLRNKQKTKYHTCVIDAFKDDVRSGQFMVHVNFGEGNKGSLKNGWFDFNKKILIYNDINFKAIMILDTKGKTKKKGKKKK